MFRKNGEIFKNNDHLGFRTYDEVSKKWVYVCLSLENIVILECM
jgi:hypothetical protein